MIELENWCAYFSKKIFAPSPTYFLPQSFGKTSAFDKAQSNEKDKDNIKGKEVDEEEEVDAKGNNIMEKSTENQKEKEKSDQGKGTEDTKLHVTSTEDLK